MKQSNLHLQSYLNEIEGMKASNRRVIIRPRSHGRSYVYEAVADKVVTKESIKD